MVPMSRVLDSTQYRPVMIRIATPPNAIARKIIVKVPSLEPGEDHPRQAEGKGKGQRDGQADQQHAKRDAPDRGEHAERIGDGSAPGLQATDR